MAIDSKAKRASVLGIVLPDGTIDQGDRQTVLDIYRGILAAEAVEASTKQACIAIAAGSLPAIAFTAGAVAAIAFSTGDLPAIAFTATSCN